MPIVSASSGGRMFRLRLCAHEYNFGKFQGLAEKMTDFSVLFKFYRLSQILQLMRQAAE